VEAVRKNKNFTKYKRIQRVINIKITKAYRSISYDASCVTAGVQPIQITTKQKVQTYMTTKINYLEYDAPLEVRKWRNPAELATVHEMENGCMCTAEVYTDGSKTGNNVRAAGIVSVNRKLVHQLKFKLHGHCYNDQAEQIAIIKVLKKLEEPQDGQDNDKHVAIYTDSKITLDLLQNKFKWNHLIELWTSCTRQDAKKGDYNMREGKWTSYVAMAVDE